MPQRVTPAPSRSNSATPARAFTLVELLMVMLIIVILISILIPAVSRVRRNAQDARNRAWVSQLSQAIDQYNTDFRAYPGPLSNEETYSQDLAKPANVEADTANAGAITTAGFLNNENDFSINITMAENAVLGLLGGLRYDSTNSKVVYDPRSVGSGPAALSVRAGKRSEPYVESKYLFWRTAAGGKTGKYQDEGGVAKDSFIPELMDTYPDQMPLLILRAKKGSPQIATAVTNEFNRNAVITYDSGNHANRVGHYDLHQIIAYTGEPIGVGRTVTPVHPTGTSPHGLSSVDPLAILTSNPIDTGQAANYHYPFNAYPYFRNQTASTPAEGTPEYATRTNRNDVAQQKDGYMIISAGLDRVYGTRDDVTNFGPVGN